jgi:phosphohistidine swiveling domain-containing protein
MQVIGKGRGVGDHPAAGTLRIIESRREFGSIEHGDIVLLRRPDSELVLWLDRVCAIISRSGGTTAHLALIAMEAGIPYFVLHEELQPLANGDFVMVNPSRGEISRSEP